MSAAFNVHLPLHCLICAVRYRWPFLLRYVQLGLVPLGDGCLGDWPVLKCQGPCISCISHRFYCSMRRPNHSLWGLIARTSKRFAPCTPPSDGYADTELCLRMRQGLPLIWYESRNGSAIVVHKITIVCSCRAFNASTNFFSFWLTWQFRRGEWRTTGRCERRWRQWAKSKPFGRQRRCRLAIGSGSRLAEHAPKTGIFSLPRRGNVAQIHVEKLVFGFGRVSHTINHRPPFSSSSSASPSVPCRSYLRITDTPFRYGRH